eukprot:1660783-Prymnesium_polylepis.1
MLLKVLPAVIFRYDALSSGGPWRIAYDAKSGRKCKISSRAYCTRAWTRQAPTRGGVNKYSTLSTPRPCSVRVRFGVTVRRENASPASFDVVATYSRTARRRGAEIRFGRSQKN